MGTIGMGGRLHYGASCEWYTPPHIFDAIGISFDLDPCSPVGGIPWVPARHHFSESGLDREWFGSVWLNPPYGRETQAWVRKLAKHGDGVALVFARTDAKWAQDAIRSSGAVCFVAGRISFIDGSGHDDRKGRNAPAASMLLGFGNRCAEAVASCGLGISFDRGMI